MKTKSMVKAGALSPQHNQSRKTRAGIDKEAKQMKTKSMVKAGSLGGNHNQSRKTRAALAAA